MSAVKLKSVSYVFGCNMQKLMATIKYECQENEEEYKFLENLSAFSWRSQWQTVSQFKKNHACWLNPVSHLHFILEMRPKNRWKTIVNLVQNKSKQFFQFFWSFFPVLSLAAVNFNIHAKVQPQRDNFES